ncbi:MAG: FAD-dependent oxidoreductase [Nocardiaceae bacterium]|nr:FAD-dependent oxidoreductase [Nocardiaceae bacterium]
MPDYDVDLRSADVLVVGGGMAGYRAATALAGGSRGREVTILGAEPEPPYNRPKLTKDFLQGRAETADVLFASADDLRERGIGFVGDAHAVALDTERQVVELEDGRRWAYSDLVIATGCRPRQLDVMPSGAANVFHVHNLAQAHRLRAAMDRLGRTGNLVIVGGGFIGTEVAYAAWLSGLSITIIERTSTPLSAALGAESAGRLASVYRDAGARLVTNAEIAHAVLDGDVVTKLQLSSGEVIECDIVVVGIGTVPNTEWLLSSGVALDNGVLTDTSGATNRPHVYAAGDVARWDRAGYGHIRIEHETDAQNQGMVVARHLLGRPGRLTGPPYVWSDQFGLEIRYLGHCPRPDDSVLIQRSRESFATVYAVDGLVRAVSTVNWPEASVLARQLLDAGTAFDADELQRTFSNL